jgi:hypothetical protein|tara:strand:- start:25 stop:234 length:210 start_codon:yes stop_codon:yes gene_type:complete
MKVMTIQMQENPGVIETITDMLNHISVDGETMEYILRQVGMQEQMLRQLSLKANAKDLFNLVVERAELL